MEVIQPAPNKVMKRILFVDDDPSVLAGLANAFRRDRTRWEIRFALGGDAALVELARGGFDVVVSDMRMPGMSGTTLLNIVKQHSPATVLLMLSGSADMEEISVALATVDELISKPSDTPTLRATIERWLSCQFAR